jgi:hypothetical protein
MQRWSLINYGGIGGLLSAVVSHAVIAAQGSVADTRPRFGVLGPLQVWMDGRLVLPAPHLRELLAVLLLHNHEVVGIDRLTAQMPDGRSRRCGQDVPAGR